ncbi:hypothetical protein [Mycolicibacterium mageritense]|uniref:hypothetical protein n=1 Tax=Mycolicibacterium mageritense TaxID=53462 RepID=UPI001E411D1E|nr:hypothetical protein [Mycolicibacterium mageritense]GJJ23769.1 hypothetical protein MTY414_74430 [Mycolicibacterium mageritense]
MNTPALTAAAQHHDDASQPATPRAKRRTARHRKNLVTATAIALAFTGILGLVVATAPSERGPQPLAEHRQPPEPDRSGAAAPQDSVHVTPYGPPYGADLVLERACGAIKVIDSLTTKTLEQEPYPGKDTPPLDGHVLIEYANALNHVDRQGLSTTLNAAITAHVYALTNLGAMINHHASHEDVGSMVIVVDTTAAVLHEFCRT